MRKNLYQLFLALALVCPAAAAPPATLGYQGKLATSGGQPISGIVSITLRVYDVASGGSALWTETQNNVLVDGGNLAVELGKVTPLPASIFGRQLYLGVRVAGDSEMLPRPPLTVAPFALRAKSTLKNTIFVSAEGTPAENGTALLAATDSAGSASAANPIAIEMDAGTFDLGASTLFVPPYVTLGGRSQEATRIASSSAIAVQLLENTSAHDFTASANGIGIAVASQNFDTAPNVRLRNVTGIAAGAPGAGGNTRWGIYFCATNSRAENVTGIAQGGDFSIGFGDNCFNSSGNIIEHVVATASGSARGVYGASLAGSGTIWRDFKVFVTSTPTALAETHGIALGGATVDVGSLLSNALVSIDSGGVNENVTGNMEGIVVLYANVDLEQVTVKLENTRSYLVTGLTIASEPGDHVVRVTDADIAVSGAQLPLGGSNARVNGIWASGPAAAHISRAKVVVRCGGTAECAGVKRTPGISGQQAGALLLDQVDVTVGHEGAANATAFDAAYFGEGAARITNSTLRVLRGPAGESLSVVNAGNSDIGDNTDIRITGSTLLVESTATPTPDCLFGGTTDTIVLYGSHVKGFTCPGTSAHCVASTREGAGLLGSACN